MMTPDEIIAVVTAFKEGKKIESRYMRRNEWLEAPAPCWNFNEYEYRVKKEPREFWVNIHERKEHRMYASFEAAVACLMPNFVETIHVREVL